MTPWAVAVALAWITFLTGLLLGRWHERRHQARRRGGMLPAPTAKAVVDRWNFPAAPKVYDQDQDPTEGRSDEGGGGWDYQPTRKRAGAEATSESVVPPSSEPSPAMSSTTADSGDPGSAATGRASVGHPLIPDVSATTDNLAGYGPGYRGASATAESAVDTMAEARALRDAMDVARDPHSRKVPPPSGRHIRRMAP